MIDVFFKMIKRDQVSVKLFQELIKQSQVVKSGIKNAFVHSTSTVTG
jgi:hypothetical protein